MKLPNAEKATVPRAKIILYLLSPTHRDGQHKATFFRSLGFTLESWEALASALLAHARAHEVTEVVSTPFGKNYVVEGPLPAPDGRAQGVRVVWFVAKQAEIATLATAYPLDT
jgi:hypothetical protein